ncbi:hypothetical protein [Sciscionella sediminilitoris]|uniref:hypothetical protein n=1 Tax=Sciscionella sediminilitoris TaxID=1445613 RepID=UPI0004DF167A|nr:hypothetical protein [Sciscionella sp. SE31]
MNEKTGLAEELLAAVSTVDGLRPATPATVPKTVRAAWNVDTLAVDVSAELVEIRLVAAKLPLPGLLAELENAVRPILADSEVPEARLRLVVADLDRAALDQGTVS